MSKKYSLNSFFAEDMEESGCQSREDTLRYEETQLYEEKIRRLEETIGTLRMSRRILLSLLEQSQSAHEKEYRRLCLENSRLRNQAHRYALLLWQKQINMSRELDE